jgi:uncharacterized protein YkwD
MFVLPGLFALALVAGGALYLTRPAPPPGAAATQAIGGMGTTVAAAADVAVAGPPAVATVPPGQTAKAGRAAPASSAATGTATAASGSGSAGTAAAGQVLALINQARASAGLPALTVTAGLDTSATAHTMKMAGGCGLSHQCPGEAAIGDRETAAGVIWSAAGENIGEGGPVAATPAAIAQMAAGLTQSMLNEQPPDDGHRMNILSSTFTHIGIGVYRDSSGTVRMTQDFSN